MALDKKDFEGDHINVDKYTLNDFGEYRGDDLFEVTEYFWEYVQEGMRRKYMVYGHPMMSSPKTEFEVFDRNAGSVRTFLNFCSYNYLGSSYHPEVIKAVQEAVEFYGTGAVSAPLLSGYSHPLYELEQEMARIKGKEAAIAFSTGYGTNVGILSALLRPGDIAVLDILSHASIYDGVRLSGADIKVFAHNSPKNLEKVLKNLPHKRAIVCVEGVYSMDGDLANLPEIIPICKRYGVKTLVDEAHASLVFGERGGGVAEHFGLEDQVDISIGTFSKSFGAIGGFAAGTEKVMNFCRIFSRAYLFSCAMAPHTAAGILKVIELFKKDPSTRDKLWENTRYMWKALTDAGLDIADTKSQVIPVMVGSDIRLREISKRLLEKGLYTGIVTFPAVSKNKTRLRLSVSSAHTKEQMDRCVTLIREVFDEMEGWQPDL
ncbi:MAG: aminotransferase class I/II-fold pyridoxal phosphate-dependent enzyme [Candidatus Aminicenantes bacterium]|nr:aminotransferase class I/II-fold pyridoxal phosphate-dependent enzyme [Candidatus Aminicenantes bacterium]